MLPAASLMYQASASASESVPCSSDKTRLVSFFQFRALVYTLPLMLQTTSDSLVYHKKVSASASEERVGHPHGIASLAKPTRLVVVLRFLILANSILLLPKELIEQYIYNCSSR